MVWECCLQVPQWGLSAVVTDNTSECRSHMEGATLTANAVDELHANIYFNTVQKSPIPYLSEYRTWCSFPLLSFPCVYEARIRMATCLLLLRMYAIAICWECESWNRRLLLSCLILLCVGWPLAKCRRCEDSYIQTWSHLAADMCLAEFVVPALLFVRRVLLDGMEL